MSESQDSSTADSSASHIQRSRNGRPSLLVIAALAMAVARYPLMSSMVGIPWGLYKATMLLLALGGFGWQLARNRKHARNICGAAALTLSFILFSLFLKSGSDQSSFYPFGIHLLILDALLFVCGLVLFMNRTMNIFSILGALMIAAALFHLLGELGNAAGAKEPTGYFLRMNLLYWGGWILYFLGKRPTPGRFFLNLLILIGITFISIAVLVSVIH